MSKIVPINLGIPVPTTAPPATDHVIVYYGTSPMTPSYTQSGRIDVGPVSGLKQAANAAGVNEYRIPLTLPPNLTGNYDFAATLMSPQPDGSNGDEGNFPAKNLTLAIDTTVPPTLGTPVLL